MEKKEEQNHSSLKVDHHNNKENDIDLENLIQTLDHHTYWDGTRCVKYDGFWCPVSILRPIQSTQRHFKPRNSDIILASIPKSGTTWLKALTFSISNRDVYKTTDQSPLLTTHPHSLVPFLEFDLYLHRENPDLKHLSIFSTHIPFEALPESIRESGCKIIYICRNPLDQFISLWHFVLENESLNEGVPLELDEAFDMFCQGTQSYGPFWDHIPGYWNAHLTSPEKVLFLKYEDLKGDIGFYIKKIAEFLGCPFSIEEERRGVVEEIARLCSIGNLKSLEVSKAGQTPAGVFKNSSYYRKGEVGDWRNYLTPAMADRVKKLMDSKLEGCDLIFNP